MRKLLFSFFLLASTDFFFLFHFHVLQVPDRGGRPNESRAMGGAKFDGVRFLKNGKILRESLIIIIIVVAVVVFSFLPFFRASSANPNLSDKAAEEEEAMAVVTVVVVVVAAEVEAVADVAAVEEGKCKEVGFL